MGVVKVLAGGPEAMAFVEPAALAAGWQLKLGPPLMSWQAAYQGYLAAIFMGVLKNTLP